MTDTSSTYSYNYAGTGGVYYITASDGTAISNTISGCTYYANYGDTGGVFAVYDQIQLTITSSSFYYNWALKSGGVLYAGEIGNNYNPSSLVMSYCTFQNSYSYSYGSVLGIAQAELSVEISESTFT
jgi:hypothetical protein